MKKLLSLAMLVGFLGVVTGCTSETKPTTKSPAPTTGKTAEPEKKHDEKPAPAPEKKP